MFLLTIVNSRDEWSFIFQLLSDINFTVFGAFAPPNF